jgi:flavin reductase (DIM6/NTAB) family NADH-FMN oxidoreductase RutF
MDATTVVGTTINEGAASQVLEAMPYGEYIVGSFDGGHVVNGMMADWVMQVAFQPRMIAVSLENDAHTLANIRANRYFTVNLLPEDEEGRRLSSRFAQPYFDSKIPGRRHTKSPDGTHRKLETVPHGVTPHGAPVLNAGLGWLECEADIFVPAGDHTLVTARVINGQLLRDAEPLTSTYTGWTYAG